MPQILKDNGYIFQPHELPLVFGSPAIPEHPLHRRIIYTITAILIAIAGSLQNGFVLANTTTIQGFYHLTAVEMGWVSAAYYMVYGVMSVFFFRFRQMLGPQIFIRIGWITLLASSLFQLIVSNFQMELIARTLHGISANACIVMSLFYAIQVPPRTKRPYALMSAFSFLQLGIPLAYMLTPWIMPNDNMQMIHYFELALALVTVSFIIANPIPPSILIRTFEWNDVASLFFLTIMVSCCAMFYTQVRIQWWGRAWMFWPCVIGFCSLIAFIFLEYRRRNPILPLKWLLNKNILIFMLTGIGVRITLAEQTIGSVGLLQSLGYNLTEYHRLYIIIFCGGIFGLLLACYRFNPTDIQRPIISSLLLIGVASFIDGRATINSVPADFYISQAMVAFASVYLFGPMVMEGIMRTLSNSPFYIIGFACCFSSSQLIGSLFATAILDFFTKMRIQYHYNEIANAISLGDARISSYIATQTQQLAASIPDSVQQHAQAIAKLAQDAVTEATVQGYRDLFHMIGYFTFVLLACILLRNLWLKLRGTHLLANDIPRMMNIAQTIAPKALSGILIHPENAPQNTSDSKES